MTLIAVQAPERKNAIFGSTTSMLERAKMQKVLEKIMNKRGGNNDQKKTQTTRKDKRKKGTKGRRKKTRFGYHTIKPSAQPRTDRRRN